MSDLAHSFGDAAFISISETSDFDLGLVHRTAMATLVSLAATPMGNSLGGEPLGILKKTRGINPKDKTAHVSHVSQSARLNFCYLSMAECASFTRIRFSTA
jgi:hypothetical protein